MTPDEIRDIFFVECDEALASAEAGLTQCQDGSADDETINAIFRAVHSIKGGAGAFGFTALQAFTHGFETLLSDVRDGLLPLGNSLNSLMLRALDILSDHVLVARDGGEAPDDRAMLVELEAALASTPETTDAHEEHAAPVAVKITPFIVDDFDLDLDAMISGLNDEPVPDTEISAGWRVRIRPLAGALKNGSEPILLLRELERLGGTCIAADSSAIPVLSAFNPAEAYLGWEFAMPATVERSGIEEIFDFIGDECTLEISEATSDPCEIAAPVVAPLPVVIAEPAPAAEMQQRPVTENPVAASSSAAHNQSIRIDLSKLDRLIDTVGELVIAQAMMAQRLAMQGLGASDELAVLDGLTRDIQESAMGIRAQPIGSVFGRVPRTVRELEASTGKSVRLEMVGESTELDKTVLERLGEPLTHLIRNAVDHGIESPEDRIAAGKKPQGVLRLSAEQRSGRIIIKVRDDGRGIDRDRVFAKAVERGLVSPDATLSAEDIDNLIFAPGFSTAETVSTISGRGVGMDVVRQNVKDLGGRISIESVPGQGSIFTLALPLTLAISDGMIVTVGDQTLVVPLAHVIESLRPQPADVSQMGSGRSMLNIRGQFIPVIPLAPHVGAHGTSALPSESVLIVVDTESSGQAALQVDSICDQRQFVIKSLATHYRSIEGVAGATILGNGNVALIVDVDGLVAEAVSQPQNLMRAA